ncbi:hypothetical protein OPV22_009035 [Ensete ventricosum]|uniref:Uncharacterized protein n=1 Tax=Ensete ventricosum TaxID=4639 RepID=A0AAV8REX9_ENSVE|nr:hypothetical protein OPV22_009035 [Ensete ventricosum]
MLAEGAHHGVVGDNVGMGPIRVHTAQAGGGPAQITDATITVDDGVEDDDVGIAAESGESDVHESLGGPAATVPSDEGDSGIEGRNVGVESTEAGVV